MLSVRKSAGLLLLVALLALLQPVRQAAATDPTATDPTATDLTATDLTATDVSFTSDGRTLHGTLLAPAGARGLPAMVLVAGSGSTSRAAYQPEAEAFARAGVVTLVYDKRAGYSRATTSFDDLATDALAALDLLRRRPEADPRQTGLWGHSQGGWVVPLAAARADTVAFLVTVGAGALRPDRTQLWSNRAHLAHAGVAERLIDPIGTRLSRVLMAAGLFGDTGNDPVANLARVRRPLLAVFAEHDRSTAPGESLAIFRQALERGGHGHYALKVVRDADHDLRASHDGFTRGSGFAPGYVDTVASWVKGLAAGPPAVVADPPPAQPFASRPVAAPAWHESPVLHVVVFAAMLAAFACYGIGGAVRRVRGRAGDDRGTVARWAPRVVAAGGTAVLVGTLLYLGSVVMTGATEVDAAVLGRPPWWLALQLLTALTVVAGVVSAVGAQRSGFRRGGFRRGGFRRGVLLSGALLLVPWAAYWGLLTP
jgi:dienelactone hydrolase